jgi:hypothetical protein
MSALAPTLPPEALRLRQVEAKRAAVVDHLERIALVGALLLASIGLAARLVVIRTRERTAVVVSTPASRAAA